MEFADLTRFQQAQLYFQLPKTERTRDKDLAEAGRWLEQLCVLLIGQQVRRTRKKWSFAEEEDRVNQVWVNLLKKLPRLRYNPARGSLIDWLTKVIERILISFSRRRKRPMEALDAATALPSPDESTAIRQAELARELRAALAFLGEELGAKNLELIELHWVEGRSLKDAAEQLDLSNNEAKCRQRRALRKLRELLPFHTEWPCLAEWIDNHSSENRKSQPRIRDTFERHETYLGL